MESTPLKLQGVVTYPDMEGSTRLFAPAHVGPVQAAARLAANLMFHARDYLAAERTVVITIYMGDRVLWSQTFFAPPEPRKPLYSAELLAQIEAGFDV